MLAYVRASRVPLYFIGIGFLIGDNRMKSLAAETGGIAYFVRHVNDLPETYRKLEEDLRSQYVIGYQTESSKNDTEYRTVEVKVDRPDAKVRTIHGYLP
jgi:VWFA-related protein